MTGDLAALRFDTAPLTAPVNRQEVVDFRRRSRAEGTSWAVAADAPGIGLSSLPRLLPLAVPLLIFVAMGSFLGPRMADLAGSLGYLAGTAPFPFNLIPIAFVVVPLLVVAAIVTGIVRWILSGGGRGWWERVLRLTRFAAANDLEYGHAEPVDYPGCVFQAGTRRRVEDRLSTITGRSLEVGNYRYVIESGSGKDRREQVYRWGYLAIGLDRNLPHMVLDATANDRSLFGIRSSNLPVAFDRSQVLSLEGDFDRHFTLYAPAEYERDALYVFTPDLMALLIDETGHFDVEIVDDRMFVYSSTPFDLVAPATWDRVAAIAGTVGAKALRQTARYADARVADPILDRVAEPGRRLKRRTSWVGAVLGAVLLAFWLWNLIGGGWFWQ